MAKFKGLKHKPGGVVKNIRLESKFDNIGNTDILKFLINETAKTQTPQSCIGGKIEVFKTGERSAIVQYLPKGEPPKTQAQARGRGRGPMGSIWFHAGNRPSLRNFYF